MALRDVTARRLLRAFAGRSTLSISISLSISLAACAPSGPRGAGPTEGEHTARVAEPIALSKLTPMTTVWVDDTNGPIAHDVEGDYLPQVVCCENGAAPSAALEAQAVMARTYMYFGAAADGLGTMAKPFTGTQADQAYHCSSPVSQACKDAVTKTADQITASRSASGALVANVSFFVDGPRPACLAGKSCACLRPSITTPMTPQGHEPGCDCFTWSSNGAANPAYVTYNWDHAGTTVVASTLGSTSNESNRGCASQNIQACLAYAGWGYLDQLKFFYGQDLELRHPDGSAVDAGAGDGAADAGTGGDASDAAAVSEAPSDSGCSVTPRPRRAGDDARAVLGLLAVALLVVSRARRPSRAG